MLYGFSIAEMRFPAVPKLILMFSTAETMLIGFLDESVTTFRPGTNYLGSDFGFLV